jgi:hypothetical protein
MGHAEHILRKLAEFKCLVCGKPIGKEYAGCQVHMECMGDYYVKEGYKREDDEARS